MQTTLVSATLSTLDTLKADLLVVGIFTDDRPLRGVASLLDWRLNGKLSTLLISERFHGHLGESLLLPSGGRVGPPRLLLAGLGAMSAFTQGVFQETVHRICTMVLNLKCYQVAMGVPGGHRNKLVHSPNGLKMLLETAQSTWNWAPCGGNSYQLMLVERTETHKDLKPVLNLWQDHIEKKRPTGH